MFYSRHDRSVSMGAGTSWIKISEHVSLAIHCGTNLAVLASGSWVHSVETFAFATIAVTHPVAHFLKCNGFNRLRLKQKGQRLADDIFKCIFLYHRLISTIGRQLYIESRHGPQCTNTTLSHRLWIHTQRTHGAIIPSLLRRNDITTSHMLIV